MTYLKLRGKKRNIVDWVDKGCQWFTSVYSIGGILKELDEWARLCPLFKTWNMKRFLFILIICEQMALACVAANRTIKGHVVDESGRNAEFASIHVDSIYAVSDKGGNFSLVVPDGMKQEIVISHISYQMYRIPFGVYSKNNELNITLKEKISNLCDITDCIWKNAENYCR